LHNEVLRKHGLWHQSHTDWHLSFRDLVNKLEVTKIWKGSKVGPRKSASNRASHLLMLRPVAQLYGQVRTDWNLCFVIDCSLSHPAGHKPSTCSHSVLRNTCLNIHAVRWMSFSSRFFMQRDYSKFHDAGWARLSYHKCKRAGRTLSKKEWTGPLFPV